MKKTMQAFTLIESIFALCITCISVLLLSSSIFLFKTSNFLYYKNEDNAFLYQMQLLYMLSSNHEIYGDMLYFQYGYDEMYFELMDDTLVLKDGYQVFLNDVKNARFYNKKGCTYIEYERDKTYEKIIGCKK